MNVAQRINKSSNHFDSVKWWSAAANDSSLSGNVLESLPAISSIHPIHGDKTSTWSYYTSGNGKGLLQSVSATDYEKVISYDDLGRLSSETTTIKGDAKTFSYTYDGFSRLASKTYASGFEIGTRYTATVYKDAL